MSQPSPADPSDSYKIFISYRRDDGQATVDHIYDWLVRAFTSSLGPKAIFKDVDSIPSGFGFPGVVNSTMRQCRVVLIVIGPSWTTLLSDKEPYKGQPRLNDPADNVRVEVEQALTLAPINDAGEPASDVLLIPVLVQGARMPDAEQLPASLRPLTERNGRSIRPDPDFAHTTMRLITRIANWIGVAADDPRGEYAPPPVITPLSSNEMTPPSEQHGRVVAGRFADERDFLLRSASSLVGMIKKIWGRDDFVAHRKMLIDKAILKEIERQSSILQRTLTSAEIQQIRTEITQQFGGVPELSIGLLTHAWVRRIAYLLLVVLCVVSYFILVTSRLPILIGGSEAPPFLQVFFQYFQVITGGLFVLTAALSGMLIQERSSGLPDVVKAEPDIGPIEAKIKLGLAVTMFVLNVIFVTFLTLGGIYQEYGQSADAQAVSIVVSCISILVAGNILLAWAGLYQAARGVLSLLLGGGVALFCIILTIPFLLLGVLVLLLDGITGWLVAPRVCYELE